MTKEESKMMQGVAILLMVFFHLFTPSLVGNYQNTFWGNAARASNPVSFYVIISGYGLYVNSVNGGGKKMLKRCLSLYLNYWTITIVFVLLEYSMNNYRCNFGMTEVLLNMTAFKTSYYPVAWFVIPYCLLVCCSSFIFGAINRLPPLITLSMSYCVYVFASWMNRYPIFGMNIFQTLYILFPFILGALMAKYDIIGKAKQRFDGLSLCWLPYLLLVSLLGIRYVIYSGAFASLFAGLFILLFVCAAKPKWLERVLLDLGNASFGMWMIHAWICWYLFRDAVYGLGNPLLIFIVVTLVSYVLAILFNYILSTINNLSRLIFHG